MSINIKTMKKGKKKQEKIASIEKLKNMQKELEKPTKKIPFSYKFLIYSFFSALIACPYKQTRISSPFSLLGMHSFFSGHLIKKTKNLYSLYVYFMHIF